MSNKVKSTTSKSLGEYLLKGYAMLADNCPSCLIPLMRDPKTLDRLCVNCDRVFKAGESIHEPEEEEEEGEEEEEVEVEVATAMQPSPKPHQAVEKPDPSKLLSDKMLQGWALLETSCPVCSTPLVRDKAKRMLCVSCDLFVMTEAEAAAKAPPKAPASSRPKAVAPSAAVIPSVTAVAQASSNEPSTSTSSSILEKLSQSLVNKLQEASRALDNKSVANGASEIKDLASMITECAQAIKALKSLAL